MADCRLVQGCEKQHQEGTGVFFRSDFLCSNASDFSVHAAWATLTSKQRSYQQDSQGFPSQDMFAKARKTKIQLKLSFLISNHNPEDQ